jgi:hypothetical protein
MPTQPTKAHVLRPDFWKKMQEHGFQTGALMLERMGSGFDPIYTLDELKRVGELSRARDIELVLTTWTEPSKKYLDDLRRRIRPMLEASGCSGWEFDKEGNWLPPRVEGFANLDKAGDYFVEIMTPLCEELDVRSELTTYPFHPENSKRADVSPHVDRLLAQAYSVYMRKDGAVPFDGPYGPRKMVTTSLERTKQVPGVGTSSGPLISCGLAAYDQKWPGTDPVENMRIAYNEALAYEPIEIRYWSTKWIFGIKVNTYASKFFKSLLA